MDKGNKDSLMLKAKAMHEISENLAGEGRRGELAQLGSAGSVG